MPDLTVQTPTVGTSAGGNGKPSTPPAFQGAVITFGPLTLAQVTQVLEQQLAAVWAAALESHGADWREGWALKLEHLRLEKVGHPEPAA